MPSPDRPEIKVGMLAHLVMDGDLTPRAARALIPAELFDAFAEAGVPAFAIKGPALPGPAVGVHAEHRDLALKVVAERLPGPGRYLQEVYPGVQDQPVSPLSARRVSLVPRRCPALRLAQLWATGDGALAYGMDYGTVLEFWETSPDEPDVVVAPLPNAASEVAHRDYLAPAGIELEGREWPSISLFDRTFLDEVAVRCRRRLHLGGRGGPGLAGTVRARPRAGGGGSDTSRPSTRCTATRAATSCATRYARWRCTRRGSATSIS